MSWSTTTRSAWTRRRRGALVSNVLDLVKWHQALEAGELVSSASYEAMYRPTKLADGNEQPYGYGWGLGELAGNRKLSHGGGINGFSTMIARYPDDRLAVIVLANTAGFNTGAVEGQIAKVLLGRSGYADRRFAH